MKVFLAACAVAFFSLVGTTKAGSIAYLDLGANIKGESVARGYEKMIDLQSWTLGASQEAVITGTGLGAGKASFKPAVFYKIPDAASPFILLACAAGTHIPTVVLHVVKQGYNPTAAATAKSASPSIASSPEYLTITLSNVLISDISVGGSNGDETPQEAVTLVYNKIVISYTPQDPNTGKPLPKITKGWDLKTNSATTTP